MNRWLRWMGLACVAASGAVAATVGGCSSSEKSAVTVVYPDASTTPGPNDDSGSGRCTPGAKDCLNDSLARVCSSDGTWLAFSCSQGEKCTAGDCKINEGALCTPGDAQCVNATTSLVCKDDGTGYAQVTCPAGTTCSAGKCRGAVCAVGDSVCDTSTSVQTCADGNSYTTTSCPANQHCVTTASGNGACKADACPYDPTGCNTVCGNKLNAAADQTKFISICTSTANGYNWVPIGCLAPATCNPQSSTCGAASLRRFNANCAAQCVPGATRCASNTNGYQTCDATGNWPAAVTLCNPNPQAGGLFCADLGLGAVCADALCADGWAGTCTANGQYRACGLNGKLQAAAACPANTICKQIDPSNYLGSTPGACQAECLAGDERCVGPNGTSAGYQACVNGQWGPVTQCAAGTDGGGQLCQGYTSPNGRPAKVCGECIPGRHRCQVFSNDAGGVGIATCGANAVWSDAVSCTAGACASVFGDAVCMSQCIPGAKVCVGPGVFTNVNNLLGTRAEGTCTASGTLPIAPDCSADASATGCCTTTGACRRNGGGAVLGCVECVGTSAGGNERTLFADTQCIASDAGPGNDSVRVCGAANTWGTPTACPNGTTCATSSSQPAACQ